MKDVQRANAVGEELEAINANIEKGYQIKSIESHLVHVELENPSFDSRTGKKNSKPFIQCFYPNEFDLMVKNNSFAGLTVKKIHDPRRGNLVNQASAPIQGNQEVPGPNPDFDPNEGLNIDDPIDLSKMNKAQLEQRFFDLFGEDAPKATKAELILLIKEKTILTENAPEGQ